MGRKAIDLTGLVFGRTTGVSLAEPKGRNRRWNCKCSCGTAHVARAGDLLRGDTKSCGCLRIEVAKVAFVTHGGVYLKEYAVWCGMKQRCLYKNHKAYLRYGGRGISVADEWLSFDKFYEDMGPRPSQQHSIERIDNNGDYCKSNCVWATRKEQQANTSRSRVLTLNGEAKTMSEWADSTGLSYYVIRSRKQRGWSDEKTLITQLMRR